MSTLTNMFHYAFMIRGLEAGVLVALVAPIIGIFLVLRRYSLIADTLSHVSLAGVALGLLMGVNPIISALFTSLVAAVGIERIRATRRIYGESSLALFMSGGLALAIVLISMRASNANITSYLFGSIVTVTQSDVYLIAVVGLIVCAAVAALYKELVYVSFDEESAQVSGVPVALVNLALIFATALLVSIAIPVVGILLVSALVVIPVIAALQLKKNFFMTIVYAEAISVISVLLGIGISFYANIAASGAIVLIMLAFLAVIFTATSWIRGKERCC